MQASRRNSLYIPLAQLNAYAYCHRRVYYEFTLGEMVVNEYVLEGQQLHERVDQFGSSTRGEKIQLRHSYLCAPVLGLLGYCDLLEGSETTTDLKTLALEQKLYPVEYKKGKIGKWLSDHTQLCAQALALEEVLAIPMGSITHGYLFYIGSSRRDEVSIDAALRNQALTILEEARHVAAELYPPEPITNWRKCRDCSLEPICLPREVLKMRAQRNEDDHGDFVSH
jgi:CRISPR-associated exonuclease Cas4